MAVAWLGLLGIVSHDDDLPEPWFRPDVKQARAVEAEATLEVGPGHELCGRTFRAIACCSGCDRVVFLLDDETRAIVHLTWAGRQEAAPWPNAERLGGFQATEMAMDLHEH